MLDPVPTRPSVDAGPTSPPAVDICAEPDLVLCLPFDGNANDRSATPLAAATSTGITFAPGRLGEAARLDAASALRYAPDLRFDLPPAAATIEAWIKRNVTAADAVVFDDDARFSLTISSDGKVLCKSSGGAVVGMTTVPANEWVHVACVVDGTTLRAYAAGIEDASGAGGIAASPTSAAAVGGNSPDGEPFVGLLDSFRVFKAARTAAQIKTAATP